MCTNQRYIYNRYSRKSVLVPCGKCPACQQEKACRRSTRIRNNVTDGTITLFVTLTYLNMFIPYIRKSDLISDDLEVPVYRDSNIRYTFSRQNGLSQKIYSDVEVIQKVYIPEYIRTDSSVRDLFSLRKADSDKVGVCLTSDFQKFIKRLSMYLKRKYNYEAKYSYFYCSELGSASHRPHFHALFFIRKDDEEIFRRALVACWPYADSNRTQKYVEVARDAASYVSSYVAGSSRLPEIMQIPLFKPTHNYSKHFGLVLDCFNLRSLLSQVDRGTLYYNRPQKFDGESSVVRVPIPVYVVNRYFPKHKGFGWLAASDIQRFLIAPERLRSVLSTIENPLYKFTDSEIHKIHVNLENCYKYFHKETGLGRFDYAYYYIRIWSLHFSITLRDSYEDVLDFSDFYTNFNDLKHEIVHAPTLSDLTDYECNPNRLSFVVENSAKMTNLFYKLDKQKKVTNYCMASNGHNV